MACAAANSHNTFHEKVRKKSQNIQDHFHFKTTKTMRNGALMD